MEISFRSKLLQWNGSNWIFVQLPAEDSAAIREVTSGMPRRGFGSVKVVASIGATQWETSVFPDSETQRYIMFVKKSVRQEEGIDTRDEADITLRLKNI